MKLTIKYDGCVYVGKEIAGTDEEYEKNVEIVTEALGAASYFKLNLEDGGTLVLPREATAHCVLIFSR